MKFEDNEARMALFDLEDKLATSNMELANAINKLRLAVVGGTWILVIVAVCIAVFK